LPERGSITGGGTIGGTLKNRRSARGTEEISQRGETSQRKRGKFPETDNQKISTSQVKVALVGEKRIGRGGG